MLELRIDNSMHNSIRSKWPNLAGGFQHTTAMQMMVKHVD
jgi:hypothetical protein